MTEADKLIDEIFSEIDAMTSDDILSLKKEAHNFHKDFIKVPNPITFFTQQNQQFVNELADYVSIKGNELWINNNQIVA